MERSVIISGFGGQGALFAGQLLAYAALDSGSQVTWIPSYGPEMRGGTAHCTVVIGDEPIGSPLVRNPDCIIALNIPSAEKYAPLVKPGGLLIIDSTLVPQLPQRADIRVVAVPANALAKRFGDARLANTLLLGALVGLTGVVTLAAVEQALADHLPERHRRLLAANRAALHEGAIFATTLSAASATWESAPMLA